MMMLKKILVLLMLLFVSLIVFSENVVMVFPSDDDVIVLFNDNSWFYHSQISWYDMVDFVHFDADSQFAILEEGSYRVSDHKIMIKGVAMNTSDKEKRCEIAYSLIGENQEYLSIEKLISQEVILPGHLFHYSIEFDDYQGMPKYVKFDYIKNYSE